ncbi:MAG: hypothetical protein JWO64_737 [Hyphomicrobiales bacterium]|jgi:hypothetical protein|nr:hypothetical protein [Hyphomicrobiales bacterium]
MPPRSIRVLFSLPILIAPVVASGALAQSADFSGLDGDWRGGGTLQHNNGVTERIRCEASYRLSSPERLRQSLRCRSDQSQFSLAANLSLNGREIIGDWSETTRNARGSLRGRFSPGVIQGLVDGQGFSANVTIRFAGSQQNVAIKSAGTEMTTLNMVLTRSGR